MQEILSVYHFYGRLESNYHFNVSLRSNAIQALYFFAHIARWIFFFFHVTFYRLGCLNIAYVVAHQYTDLKIITQYQIDLLFCNT